MEKNMAIRLSSSRRTYQPSNRYILSIDKCWYETTSVEAFNFSEDELPTIQEWLKNHFIYYAEFIYKNGGSEKWSAFGDKFGEVEFYL